MSVRDRSIWLAERTSQLSKTTISGSQSFTRLAFGKVRDKEHPVDSASIAV
jgi:hypothetical protein